ncbi:hypothetical protein C1891_26140 [Pseudomonas sp. GW456-12-1-14-TSB6]|uniref:Uncharacterized protein n=1 Tax=Pseudomonas fluorescens TaxID=294 RepID=A0AAE2ABB9_PSEFL|nr:hypothetical protein QS95_04680 [Pseudomonas fluorescens]POA30420.1 hypothetical protein C1891_26140 [Pseudomonas sp. GW456-12-1-14-TSB6]
MRGKLQNFAKAAILATARENCSIDDPRRLTAARRSFFDAGKRQNDGAAIAMHEQTDVNICEDSITLFN